MKKILLLTLLSLLIFSCKKDNNSNKAQKPSKTTTQYTNQNINKIPEYLTIEGNQIWVREQPKTGEVIMKLDNGTKCKVLEKGTKETINGTTDYWYKIKCKGKTGWVFGSQTDQKLQKSQQQQQQTDTQQVSNTQESQTNQSIKDFIKSIKKLAQEKNYKQIFYNDSIYLFDNHLAIMSLKMTSRQKAAQQLANIKMPTNIYINKNPVYNGENYSQDGIFVNKAEQNELSSWLTPSDKLYKKAKKDEQKIQYSVEIINNKIKQIRLDIGKINNQYKIIAIDISQEGDA